MPPTLLTKIVGAADDGDLRKLHRTLIKEKPPRGLSTAIDRLISREGISGSGGAGLKPVFSVCPLDVMSVSRARRAPVAGPREAVPPEFR
jgi:hypothetical protein